MIMSRGAEDKIYQVKRSIFPQKVAVVLESLCVGGFISEDEMKTLETAYKLAREKSVYTGFLVAYKSLKCLYYSTMIDDCIEMSKELNRPIDLMWSAKRWKNEHDVMGRFIALKKLAGNHETYDVSRFEALLPVKFPGYVIKTSTRLGMEGLRQRHCVASYGPRIKTGNTCICSVFVHKRRFTVEIAISPQADKKPRLRVTNAKTRFNQEASPDVMRVIKDFLGIKAPKAVTDSSGKNGTAERKERMLALIYSKLREIGVTEVTVRFNGYGDSGCIEHIGYDNNETQDDHIIVPYERPVPHSWHDDEGVVVVEMSLKDAIEEVSMEYISDTEVDWYNDCGGFGELKIDVEMGLMSLDISQRSEYSELAFSDEWDILSS